MDPLYILGDHHGDYDGLIAGIDHYDIRDCTIIMVGDGGIGGAPRKKQLKTIEFLNQKFAKRNIKYMAIRGNHDDPAYFDGSIAHPNFELIPDYTIKEINGQTFLFVGGAISVDRVDRKEGISYWRDEVFVLDEERAKHADVLITHSAPNWVGPGKDRINYWISRDTLLWDELVVERSLHDRLVELVAPRKLYCGHFHVSDSGSNNGTVARILNIMEMVEHIECQ
jgi:hypothetical protein